MGPGFTPAFPFTTVKSIRIVAPHVRVNEHGKKQRVDKTKRKFKNTRNKTLTVNLQSKQLWFEHWQRGAKSSMSEMIKPQNKHSINYSPASNPCHIWSCEQVCLTTTPAAWPTNLTTFSSLVASVGSSEQSHSPLCTKRPNLKHN